MSTAERKALLVRDLRRLALKMLHDPGACGRCRVSAFLLLAQTDGIEIKGED